MRVACLLASLLPLVLPGAARAVEVTGSADVGFLRQDGWSGSEHDSFSPYDFGATLGFTGSLLTPGLADGSFLGNYRQLRSNELRSSNRTDNLGFRSSLSLLNGTSLPMSFFASRAWNDFRTDVGSARLGSSRVTTLGGVAMLNLPDLPRLRVQLQRNLVDTTNAGLDSFTGNTSLTTGLDYSSGRNNVALIYSTGWDSGTLATSAYRMHAVNAELWSELAPGARVTLIDQYTLRDPTTAALSNTRFEHNNLGARLSFVPAPRLDNEASFSQVRQSVGSQGVVEREARSLSLNDRLRYRFNPDFEAYATAGGTYNDERAGEGSLRSQNGSAGLGANWQHAFRLLTVGLGGGASGGATQQAGAGTGGSWSVNGSCNATRAEGRWRLMGTYSIGLQRGMTSLQSDAFDQRGMLTYDYSSLSGRSFRGSLELQDASRTDELFGTGRDRRATASGQILWGLSNVQLSAGLTDGISERLGLPGTTDSPPIAPSSANSRTAFASLSSLTGIERWRFAAIVRAAVVRDPGNPSSKEYGFSFTAGYTIGLVALTLEERMVLSDRQGFLSNSNTVMARLSRNFGARW